MAQSLVLYLKGVDWSKINDQYLSGKYNKVVQTKPIKLKGKKNLASVPDTENGNTFTVKTSMGLTQLFFTSNCEAYNKFTKEMKPLYGGTCTFCGKKFTGLRMGIPIKIRQEGANYVVLYEGCNDKFNCVYSEFRRRNPPSWKMLDVKYEETENILFFLFNLVYPGETLIPAPDPLLSTDFEGSVTDEQSKNYEFITIPGVYLVPVKNIYLAKSKKTAAESSE